MAAVAGTREVLSPKCLRTFFSTYRFFPRPSDLFTRELATEDETSYWIGEIAHAMLLGNLIHTPTVVARADRLAAAGRYDQDCQPSKDHDCYFRVCKTGSVALIDAVTTHYTRRGDDAESGPRKSRILSAKSMMVTQKLLSAEPGLAKRLPDGVVERSLSDFHAWAGQAHFDEDRMPEARAYLWRCVRGRPPGRDFVEVPRRLVPAPSGAPRVAPEAVNTAAVPARRPRPGVAAAERAPQPSAPSRAAPALRPLPTAGGRPSPIGAAGSRL